MIKAGSDISRNVNKTELTNYLSNNGLDASNADKLLDAGIFDLSSSPENYAIYTYYEQDNNIIKSYFRSELGRREQTKHEYKIFEIDGLYIIYDDKKDEINKNNSVLDSTPNYKTIYDKKITLYDPETNKIVAEGNMKLEVQEDDNTNDITNVTSDYIIDEMKLFAYEIKDEQLLSRSNRLFEIIKEKVRKDNESKKEMMLHAKTEIIINEIIKANNGLVRITNKEGLIELETNQSNDSLVIPAGVKIVIDEINENQDKIRLAIINGENKLIGYINQKRELEHKSNIDL